MKHIKKHIALTLFFIFFSMSVYYAHNQYSNREIDMSYNPILYKSKSWINNQSTYSGSEIALSISNTSIIEFKFNTVSKATQSIEITLNGKKEYYSYPAQNNKSIKISLDKEESNKISIRYICEYFYDPCSIQLTSLRAPANAVITTYKPHKKTISVIGDSISTMYGKGNYTILLADKLRYELHNSSILSSTLVKIPSTPSAQDRYKKDISNYKSSATIIFLGTNDIANNVPVASFGATLNKILTDLKKWNTGKLFVVGILLRSDINTDVINSYNSEAENVAEKNSAEFIDTSTWLTDKDYADDIHPTLNAHKIISNNLYNLINK